MHSPAAFVILRKTKEDETFMSSYTSFFDVIGPNMIGPSSSHTAGAASIALMAKQLFHEQIVQVDFTLYGSFANTYRGHGTAGF